jgi:hypothetical protein
MCRAWRGVIAAMMRLQTVLMGHEDRVARAAVSGG